MLKAIKEYILQTFETMLFFLVLFFLVLIVIAFFALLGGTFFGPSGAVLGVIVAMVVLAALFIGDAA